MNRSASVRVLSSAFLRAFCALGIVSILVGCPAGDSAVRKSQEALTQTMQADGSQAAYGLALLSKSQSPFAQQQIIDAIRSDHAQTAREAVKMIADAPPAAAKEALQEVFANQGGLLKLNAARALANLGDAAATDFISQESLTGGSTMTAPIARLLAEGEHVDELKKILTKRANDKEQSIRDEAFALLGEIRQPWATQVLVAGLDKQRGEDRVQAIVSLGRTGDPAVATRLHKFVNTQGLVFATLEALGSLGNPDSLPIVKKMTDHDEPRVRAYAAAAAWGLGDEETGLAVLKPLVSDEDPGVRLNVAQQVRGIDSPAATALLRELLADEDHNVRLQAVRGLTQRADSAMESVFLGSLEDKSYEVSTSALDALAKIGGASSLEPIQALLGDRNPYVVMSAANAVLEIKHRLNPEAA